MKFSHADEIMYPKTFQYVSKRLGDVIHVERIAQAMIRQGDFTRNTLRQALRYGSLPKIAIRQMADCGLFHPGRPDEISIRQDICANFEQSDGRLSDVMLLGVTILHEIVHWGDLADGVQKNYEEGERFEMEAYGRLIPCP